MRILLLFLSLFLVSCNSKFFMPAPQKMVGAWEYQSVRLFKNFSFVGKDETEDFLGYTFIFRPNGKVDYFNKEQQVFYSGFWDFRSETFIDVNTEREETLNYINIHVMDNNKEFYDIVFSLSKASVNNNYIRGYIDYHKYRYKVVLKKVAD